MARSTLALTLLVVALVGSNLFWAYHWFDRSVSLSYARDEAELTSTQLKQTLAVLGAALRPGATREGIIAAAVPPGGKSAPFEKDGYLWVDTLGLRFSSQGKLLGATTEVP